MAGLQDKQGDGKQGGGDPASAGTTGIGSKSGPLSEIASLTGGQVGRWVPLQPPRGTEQLTKMAAELERQIVESQATLAGLYELRNKAKVGGSD